MIDIHSHILPGVDDGAQNLEEALTMARLAVERGTTVQFATPHVSDHLELGRVEAIAGWVADLQATLNREGIPLRLVPGAEVYPLDNLLQEVDAGRPLTLAHGGKYLLLDSPFGSLPMGLANMIYMLQTRGITPILAHPERVMPIQANPQVLEELVQRGLLLQINTSSVRGRHGEAAEVTAFHLLRLHWVHFLASDSHSAQARRPGLGPAAEALKDEFGAEMIETLTYHNGLRVLQGETIPSAPLPFTPPRPAGNWLSRFFQRTK